MAVIGLSEVMTMTSFEFYCIAIFFGLIIGGSSMSNKHFCQGTTCHEQVTQDRFLKSRGVIRGRYAILYIVITIIDNGWRLWKFEINTFASQSCES